VAKEESRNQQRGVSKDAFGLQGQSAEVPQCVLSDVFYSASENMNHIKDELNREFIMALKTNPARWHSRLRTSEREHTTSELGL
jgi:hypothetical protein